MIFMNILVDDRWFGDTGIGRYAREVLDRKPARHTVTCLQKDWKIKNPVSPWLLGGAANRSAADLFWSPGFMPPALCRKPYVVTIHDLIHLHYGTHLHRFYYDQVISRLLRSAAAVLTDSAYSRAEILDWSGLPADRVHVIPLAVSHRFTAQGEVHRPGYPYILYVGNRRVYKNIPRLIEAFALGCRNPDVRLALSGDEDPALLSVAKQFGIAERLVFLGRIEEDVLPALYRGALAVAYVSLYEGFGLPPLEAMACGTPALSSNVTSLPEVVGEAALMVDPQCVDEIAAGIGRLTEDGVLRAELVRRGLERVKSFSWDACAERTWTALEQAAATRD
jgi:glycosyltransferase involved in cell wall biosynthesis